MIKIKSHFLISLPQLNIKRGGTMSADPGAKVESEGKEVKEEIKSYPYLSSLNPAQLKGKSQIPKYQ
jgi:hypothetical protein